MKFNFKKIEKQYENFRCALEDFLEMTIGQLFGTIPIIAIPLIGLYFSPLVGLLIAFLFIVTLTYWFFDKKIPPSDLKFVYVLAYVALHLVLVVSVVKLLG